MEKFYGYDALEKAESLIFKKYKYFKVLIVSNFENAKIFGGFIENVKSNVKCCEVIMLPPGTTEINVVRALICEKLTEDVGLIINIAESVVMQVAYEMLSKIKLMCVLNAPSFEMLTFNCDFLVADFKIFDACKNKLVANCYGELCTSCFYVLEQVFNKAVFQKQIDSNAILEIESLIKDLSMLPSNVLKSKMGKRILFNMCLKLVELVDVELLNNGFVLKLSKQIILSSRYKNLQNGESQMIANVLAFKSLGVLLKAQSLNEKVGANFYDRLNFIKQNRLELGLTQVYNSFVCDNHLKEHIRNFQNIQNSFLYVFDVYFETMDKLIKTFKKLYFDNGVSLNKYMNKQVLTKAINSLPEHYVDCSYATFIRDVGLLNKLVV